MKHPPHVSDLQGSYKITKSYMAQSSLRLPKQAVDRTLRGRVRGVERGAGV